MSKDGESFSGILFLDMDGVLCTDRAYFAASQDKKKHISRCLDPVGIRLINRLCDDFNLKIVISSSWKSRYDVADILLTHGFTAEYHKDEKTKPRFSGSRGMEIRDWLEEHPEVKHFIIMDDSLDGMQDNDLSPFHCQTHYADGIMTEHYRRAVQILLDQKSGALVYKTVDQLREEEENEK